jgi:putative hydrolase of the HAD superfamily
MSCQAVVFDLFGTLVNNFFTGNYRKYITDTAAALSLPRVVFKKHWHDTYEARAKGKIPSIQANIEEIFKRLAIPADPEKIAAAVRLRDEFIGQALIFRSDARHTLEELRGMGLKTGLISNCTVETPALLQPMGILSLFNTAIFSCDSGLLKPDPKIYQRACENMSVLPRDCVYVADGYDYELAGATHVGMRAVLIRHAGEPRDSFAVEAQDWQGPVIPCLYDIIKMFH